MAPKEEEISIADNNDPYIIMKPMDIISKFSFPLFSPDNVSPNNEKIDTETISRPAEERETSTTSFMFEPAVPPSEQDKIYSIMKDTIEASSNLMCIVVNNKIIAINQSGLNLLKEEDSSDILHTTITDIIGEEYHSLFSDQISRILEKEEGEEVLLQVVPKKAPPFYALTNGRYFHNEEGFSFILELIKQEPKESISEIKAEKAPVSFHDETTGLPVSSLFEDRVEMAIARAIRTAHGKAENSSELIAIFSIEMDKTADIERSFGKEAVLYTLSTLATRLVSSFRKVDSVAKTDGTGFLMSLENLTSIDDIEVIARRVMGLVKEDINYDDINLALGCSIGISIFPYNALTVKELVSQADMALQIVKDAGGDGYAFYTDEKSEERIESSQQEESPANPKAPKDNTFSL